MTARFAIETLSGSHGRADFHSGVESLDRYFHTQVTQDIRRRATGCFVAVESVTGRVAGYYTLAAAGIALSDLPQTMAKRLPRYPSDRRSNHGLTLCLIA